MDRESFFPSIKQHPPKTILINGKPVNKDNISLGDAAIVIANFRTLIFKIFSKEVQNGLKLKDVRDYNVYFFNSPGDSRTQIIFRDALFIESLKAVREAKTRSRMQGIPQQNLSCEILQLEKEGGRIASYGTGTITGADSLEEGGIIEFEASYQNMASYFLDLGSNNAVIRKRVFDAMLDLEELSQELMTKPATSSIMKAVEKEMRYAPIPSVAAPTALSAPDARRISLFSDPTTFAKEMHLLPTSASLSPTSKRESFAARSQNTLPAITKQSHAPIETASAASGNYFTIPSKSSPRLEPIIKGSMAPESEDESVSESEDNQTARSPTIAAPAKSRLDREIKPLSEPPVTITTLFAISDDLRNMRLLPPLQERNAASGHFQGKLPPIQGSIPAITNNPNTTPPKLSLSESANIPKLVLPQVSMPESEDESVSESDSDQAVDAKGPTATRVLKVEPAQIKIAPPANRKESEDILVEGATQNTVVTRPYKLDPIPQHQNSSSTPLKTASFPYPDSKNVEAELARKEIVEEKAEDPLDEQYLDNLLDAALSESTDHAEESAEHTIVEDARPITEKSNGFKIEISKQNTVDAKAELSRILARLISSSKTKSVAAQAATPKKESGIDAENITADHIWNFARYIYRSYLETGKKSTSNDKGSCGIINRGTSTAANLDNIKILLGNSKNLLVLHCTKPNSLKIIEVQNKTIVKTTSFSQDKKADFYNVISSISAIKGLSDKQRDSILEHGEIIKEAKKSEAHPIAPKPPAIPKPKTAAARPRTSIVTTRSEEAIKPHPPTQEFKPKKPIASSAHENPAPSPRTTTAIKRPVSRASLASKPNSEQQSK